MKQTLARPMAAAAPAQPPSRHVPPSPTQLLQRLNEGYVLTQRQVEQLRADRDVAARLEASDSEFALQAAAWEAEQAASVPGVIVRNLSVDTSPANLEPTDPLTPRTAAVCTRRGVAPAELSPLKLRAFKVPSWDDSNAEDRAELRMAMHRVHEAERQRLSKEVRREALAAKLEGADGLSSSQRKILAQQALLDESGGESELSKRVTEKARRRQQKEVEQQLLVAMKSARFEEHKARLRQARELAEAAKREARQAQLEAAVAALAETEVAARLEEEELRRRTVREQAAVQRHAALERAAEEAERVAEREERWQREEQTRHTQRERQQRQQTRVERAYAAATRKAAEEDARLAARLQTLEEERQQQAQQQAERRARAAERVQQMQEGQVREADEQRRRSLRRRVAEQQRRARVEGEKADERARRRTAEQRRADSIKQARAREAAEAAAKNVAMMQRSTSQDLGLARAHAQNTQRMRLQSAEEAARAHLQSARITRLERRRDEERRQMRMLVHARSERHDSLAREREEIVKERRRLSGVVAWERHCMFERLTEMKRTNRLELPDDPSTVRNPELRVLLLEEQMRRGDGGGGGGLAFASAPLLPPRTRPGASADDDDDDDYAAYARHDEGEREGEGEEHGGENDGEEEAGGVLDEAEPDESPLAMRVETAQAATWEVPAMEQTTLAAVAARAKEEEDAVARRRASLAQPDPIAGDVILPATPLAAATKDDATDMFLQGLFAAKRS